MDVFKILVFNNPAVRGECVVSINDNNGYKSGISLLIILPINYVYKLEVKVTAYILSLSG